MCGDGANDCGALKAAHAGISLSEAESSVASPFTSREANITCVQDLIREGRAALVTSFGIFKYMAIYSLTQFISVIILYTIDSNLSDLQFLYIDLILITVLALTFGRTEPFEGTLVKQPPSANLVSVPPIVSILAHMLTIIGIQAAAFFSVQQQSWFTPYVPVEDEFASYENYAVFSVSAFQYIIMAVVFSQGSPYRKGFWTNKLFMLVLISLTALTCYIVLYPAPFLVNSLQIKLPPTFEFRLTMIAFAVCNFLIAILIEQGLVNFVLSKRRSNKSNAAKRGYMRIDHELSSREDWPPISPFTPKGLEDRGKAENIVDFSKRKVILPNNNGMKSRTLERPPLSTSAAKNNNNNNCSVNGRAARRHSSSVSIPIPMADYLGHQPQLLAAAAASKNQFSYSLDNSEIIATHINNCLNNAGLGSSSTTNDSENRVTDCRIPLEIIPPSPSAYNQS